MKLKPEMPLWDGIKVISRTINRQTLAIILLAAFMVVGAIYMIGRIEELENQVQIYTDLMNLYFKG